MKSKFSLLHLLHIAIVGFFSFLFWVYDSGTQGRLHSTFLREKVYPQLTVIAGQHANLKFKTRGPRPPKSNIVVVEVEDDSLNQFGRWPWHRDVMAGLIQSIFEAGAKHVAIDIMFSEPDVRVPPELAKDLEKRQVAIDLSPYETDGILRDVFEFNGDKLTLGWMFANPCQSAYHPDCTPPPEAAETAVTMSKFAIQRVILSRPVDLMKIPFLLGGEVLTNLPAYNAAAHHSGYLNSQPDDDGYIRRIPLVVMGPDGKIYPSLALSTAAAVMNDPVEIELSERQTIQSLRFSKSGRPIPVTPLGVMEVNFRGPGKTFQYVKANQVMSPEDGILIERDRQIASVSKKEILKDAVVFLGLNAIGVNDARNFPFETNVAGVEGHANILDNLLNDDPLRQGSNRDAGILVLYFLMIAGALLFGYATERFESVPALLLFTGVMGGGFFVDQKVLFENGRSWNTSLLLIEIFVLFVFTLAWKYIQEERNKKFVRTAFGKYVSPAIVDSIMKEGASKLTVGGEKRDLTILFSDIRSFTSFSEKMDAKLLSTFLNEYLGRMTDIVFDTEGTLDKYIGDAVMAFWGAPLDQPKHAANACRAAIKMQQALREMRPYFKQKYDVDVNVGIGINSGPVAVGNMGSERIFEYTVIGDHVNLASRMEGLTKDYHSSILTSRHTLELIERSGEAVPPHRVLDFVKVKGKKVAVEIIQILESDCLQEGFDAFQAGRAHYAKQEWDAAIAQFEIAAKGFWKDGSPDEMANEFIGRCKEFKIDPPGADWDGAWVMKTK